MAQLYWTDKTKPLSVDEIKVLCQTNECWSGRIPVKPEGGHVFCYVAEDKAKKGKKWLLLWPLESA